MVKTTVWTEFSWVHFWESNAAADPTLTQYGNILVFVCFDLFSLCGVKLNYMYAVLKEINKPHIQRLAVAKGQLYSLLLPQHDSLDQLKTVKQTLEFIDPFTFILDCSPPEFCSNFIQMFPTDETFYTLLKKNLKLHFCNFFVDLKKMWIDDLLAVLIYMFYKLKDFVFILWCYCK